MFKENKVRVREKVEKLRKGIDQLTDNSMALFLVAGRLGKDTMRRMDTDQKNVDMQGSARFQASMIAT